MASTDTGLTPVQHRLLIDDFDTEILHWRPGAPVQCLAFHGFGGNARTFRFLFAHLPDHIGLISVSLPWHGNTSTRKKGKRLNLLDWAGAFADAWDEKFDKKPDVLIAHSLGARFSAALVDRRPSFADKLFLIAPGGFCRIEDFMFRLSSTPPFRYLAPYDWFFKPYIKFLIPGLPDEKHQKTIRAMRMLSLSYPEISPRRLGVRSRFENYRGKVFILLGGKDTLLPAPARKAIRKFAPQADIEIMKETGHLPMVTHPEETAVMLLDFISDQKGNH